ncbi:MAG TPA: TraR/DksA C4-type zinc finger protein [Thermoanaerobaculia bacterium]|nr:TraR/DksA C4-type zinc finger protein [Thermoanaerobaculia bacterium]
MAKKATGSKKQGGGARKASGGAQKAKKASARTRSSAASAKKRAAGAGKSTTRKAAAASRPSSKKNGKSAAKGASRKPKAAKGGTAKRRTKTAGTDREQLRQRLVEQREEIVGVYNSDLRRGQESGDEGTEDIVDRANNAYNRELTFSLSDSERQKLLLIEEALVRLNEGTYGQCTHCGQKIADGRLQVVPWARYCIDCQELQEKGLLEDA